MAKTVLSKQFSLNLRDISRGLITAVIGAVLPILNEAFVSWTSGSDFNVNWDNVLRVGVGAGIAYLTLNFSSKSKVITVVDKEDNIKETENTINRVL